jgi:hypothetical protein
LRARQRSGVEVPATWEPTGNRFAYVGTPGTHQWYDGTPHPWEFERVRPLGPSLDDPDTVYAGVEDAGLFKSADGGQTWDPHAPLPEPVASGAEPYLIVAAMAGG